MAPERETTIDSKGNIVPKPYGYGRWHSPRKYGCAHRGCQNPATILARLGSEEFTTEAGELTTKAHNCCGEHPAEKL